MEKSLEERMEERREIFEGDIDPISYQEDYNQKLERVKDTYKEIIREFVKKDVLNIDKIISIRDELFPRDYKPLKCDFDFVGEVNLKELLGKLIYNLVNCSKFKKPNINTKKINKHIIKNLYKKFNEDPGKFVAKFGHDSDDVFDKFEQDLALLLVEGKLIEDDDSLYLLLEAIGGLKNSNFDYSFNLLIFIPFLNIQIHYLKPLEEPIYMEDGSYVTKEEFKELDSWGNHPDKFPPWISKGMHIHYLGKKDLKAIREERARGYKTCMDWDGAYVN